MKSCKILFFPHVRTTHTKNKITSFVGPLQFVHGYRTDRLVAAAQVAEGHSGVQHVEEGNLWETVRFKPVNQQLSSIYSATPRSYTEQHQQGEPKSSSDSQTTWCNHVQCVIKTEVLGPDVGSSLQLSEPSYPPIFTGKPGGRRSVIKSRSFAKWALEMAMRSMMGVTCSARDRG